MIRQRPIVFATPAYRYVAEAIMHRGFGVPGGLERKEFPDGDAFVRIIATGLLDGLACAPTCTRTFWGCPRSGFR